MEKCIKNSKICVLGGDFNHNFGYLASNPIEGNYDDPSRDDYIPLYYLAPESGRSYQLSDYPIPDNGDGPINDPCSRTYDPFAYLSPRGDRVEPVYDPMDSFLPFGFDLSPDPTTIIQDLIPISRFSSLPIFNVNFPTINDYIPISRCSSINPIINDLIPISRFSPRGDRVEPEYLFDTLDSAASLVWDPYVHDYIPEYSQSAKTVDKNPDVPKGTYYPSIPVEPTRAYSERVFC